MEIPIRSSAVAELVGAHGQAGAQQNPGRERHDLESTPQGLPYVAWRHSPQDLSAYGTLLHGPPVAAGIGAA